MFQVVEVSTHKDMCENIFFKAFKFLLKVVSKCVFEVSNKSKKNNISSALNQNFKLKEQRIHKGSRIMS